LLYMCQVRRSDTRQKLLRQIRVDRLGCLGCVSCVNFRRRRAPPLPRLLFLPGIVLLRHFGEFVAMKTFDAVGRRRRLFPFLGGFQTFGLLFAEGSPGFRAKIETLFILDDLPSLTEFAKCLVQCDIVGFSMVPR